MTAYEFGEWLAYKRLEPTEDVKSQYGFASVCATIANANRTSKVKPFEIKDFLLKFKRDESAIVKRDKEENAKRVSLKLETWLAGMKLMQANKDIVK